MEKEDEEKKANVANDEEIQNKVEHQSDEILEHDSQPTVLAESQSDDAAEFEAITQLPPETVNKEELPPQADTENEPNKENDICESSETKHEIPTEAEVLVEKDESLAQIASKKCIESSSNIDLKCNEFETKPIEPALAVNTDSLAPGIAN